MENKLNYDLELVSFALCPFVQRSVITILHKGIDFKITYIDLMNKPDWFLKISPLGKVPVLKVNGEVLFESAVINEFVDEVTPGSLLSSNPIERAKQRAWIVFGGELLMDLFKCISATNQDDFNKHLNNSFDKLLKLENVLGDSQFFSEGGFSLVDSSYAPIFMRVFLIDKIMSNNSWEKLPKVTAWAKRLLELDEVKKSVKDTFNEDFIEYLKTKDSFSLK